MSPGAPGHLGGSPPVHPGSEAGTITALSRDRS
jgi:hypothetical protein